MYIEKYKEEYKSEINELISDDSFVRKDIMKCLNEFPQYGIVVKDEGEIVAVGVFTGANKESSMTLYVKPSIRRQGIGSMILKELEKNMKNAGVLEIVCDFKDNEAEKLFLYKNRYKNWFYSNFMTYKGNKFKVEDYEIINYEDKYYYECQKILSEAFHKMRLNVGLESTLSHPSENQKIAYKENAENIFMLRDKNRIVAASIVDNNEIDAVAVMIEKQGLGYGKNLIKHSINELLDRGEKDLVLWVVEGNPARFLYEKLGFKIQRIHEFVSKRIK